MNRGHDWTIRAASEQDAERMLEIRRESILQLAVVAMSLERAQAWIGDRDPSEMAARIAAHSYWVAELDGVVAGWAAAKANRIVGLYVDPKYARSGLGSSLLSHAERELMKAGARVVTLEASWNAEDFYLNRGYEPLAPRPSDGPRPMQKTLVVDQ